MRVRVPPPVPIKTKGYEVNFKTLFILYKLRSQQYYATLTHELVHTTGHHTRLARRPENEKREFGDEKYSKEELTAEMGSAFLCAICGISKKPTLENADAYIQSWLEVFKNDKTILISAAGKAQKTAKKESNCLI